MSHRLLIRLQWAFGVTMLAIAITVIVLVVRTKQDARRSSQVKVLHANLRNHVTVHGTDGAIDQAILQTDATGLLDYDDHGCPTDSYGHPLIIRVEPNTNDRILEVIVGSIGRDGVPDTADDLTLKERVANPIWPSITSVESNSPAPESQDQ